MHWLRRVRISALSQVYELGPDGKTNPVNAGECVGCMSCVEVCPVQCITVTEM